MRTKLRRGMAAMLSVALLSVVSVGSATTAQAAAVNNQTDRIYVMNNNIENRTVGCGSNFNHLVNQVKTSGYYPDVFTVQQVANQADMADLIADLKVSWGVDYDGAIAVGSPTAQNNIYPGSTGACEKQKGYQTNAVLWRKDRFTKLGQSTWNSDARYEGSACANLATVVPAQSRTINVGVALRDNVAKRTVVAASIHWPTHREDLNRDARSCARENLSEANQAVDNLAAKYNTGPTAMRIIAGDTNAKTSIPEGSGSWWDDAIRAGYIDPIARVCGQTTGSDVAACTSHKTASVNRIDFILIEHGTTTKAGASTISAGAAGGKYSDHLAVRATAKYLP